MWTQQFWSKRRQLLRTFQRCEKQSRKRSAWANRVLASKQRQTKVSARSVAVKASPRWRLRLWSKNDLLSQLCTFNGHSERSEPSQPRHDFPTQESAPCSVRSFAPFGMTSDDEYVSPFF